MLATAEPCINPHFSLFFVIFSGTLIVFELLSFEPIVFEFLPFELFPGTP